MPELIAVARSSPQASADRELSLVDLPVGVDALVSRLDTSDRERLHRLASLGILPGASVRLLRRGSAFLASIDRYQVGFDRAVARAVWVTRSCP